MSNQNYNYNVASYAAPHMNINELSSGSLHGTVQVERLASLFASCFNNRIPPVREGDVNFYCTIQKEGINGKSTLFGFKGEFMKECSQTSDTVSFYDMPPKGFPFPDQYLLKTNKGWVKIEAIPGFK